MASVMLFIVSFAPVITFISYLLKESTALDPTLDTTMVSEPFSFTNLGRSPAPCSE